MDKQLKEYKELINQKLDEYIPTGYPSSIFDSMRYSVLADGKRLRPILAIEIFKLFSKEIEIILPTACAIEMLHVQSLIVKNRIHKSYGPWNRKRGLIAW